jgi:diguanylate cyclase (GGDEF)-like protein/PAS domain S-box-containing protein
VTATAAVPDRPATVALRPGLSASSDLPAPTPWPRTAVVGWLGVLALCLAVQQTLLPGWTHLAPAALAAATLVAGALVLRHSLRLPGLARATWRGFSIIAVLLAMGQLIRAVTGVGMNPSASGLSDLPLAATGPVAILVCVRLVRSTGGRIRHQMVLDAAVALLALGVLMEALIPAAAGGAADPMLTVVYPAISAVLVAVGLVTFAGVSAARRAAAGWLLLCFASLAVAVASGALAVTMPSEALDVVTSTAYLAMLASATLALASDPGPRAPNEESTVEVPLAGVVVSYCLPFAVLLLLLAGWAVGRPIVTLEAATVTVLMLLTFVRTLVWAADGARLTRQVLRTEAYFRTLVHRAADITIVLDHRGQITWASSAGQGSASWSVRDLEGRSLQQFVHEEDRGELERALHPSADMADGRGAVFRLRARDGGWRQFETIRTTSSAGLPDESAGSRDGLVLHLRDVAGRRSAELELERMAYTDYLTGLPNRARFMAALEAARARAAEGEPGCVLLVDLDGFKAVNDVAGHDAGDQLLCEVAAVLRAGARDRDLVARLGGDEFALLVPGAAEEAAGLAERLVDLLNRTFRVPSPDGEGRGPVFALSGSIGLAQLQPGDDATAAVRQADLALRAAKAAGKNRVRSSGQAIDSAMGRRARLARDLPAALEQGQLRLEYQPIVGVAERRVLGVEALVRWEHPLLGTVPPEEFISLAEDDGLIVPLQQWVLRTAAADAAALRTEGAEVQMAVNVSVRHLQAGCLAPDVAHALAAAGLPPQKLVLEITESVMLDAEDRLESDLATLRDMGCVIALDDFGAGYSSLAYLARLPVDVLKMDREFVAGIEGDPRSAALVAGVVGLGRTLGMDVVAEGVETTGQLATLQEMDCRFVQGFLLGGPVPLADLRRRLEEFDASILDERGLSEMDIGVHMVGRDS